MRDEDEMTSPYVDKFRDCLQAIADMADAQEDPRRKAIANNFLRHACLEFSGQTDLVLNPTMTVDDPTYHVKWGPSLSTYEGMGDVRGYYDAAMNVLSTFQDHTCWVNDWGIASYSTFVRFTTGEVLASEGMTVDKPDDTEYAQLWPMAMFWPYNQDAKLVGEDVFMLADPEHREVAPGEKLTQAEIDDVCNDLLRPLSESQIPDSN
jgi:hypothetical protein